MKRLLFLCLLFSLMARAQPPTADYAASAIQSSRYWIDVDYAGDGITGHKLDIHLPQVGKAPFPVVVCIYGSAFFSNNSKAATFQTGLGQRLLQEGFAVVSINHRSSSDAKFPAQIHDVKAAIRFIRANSAAFSLDSSFIALTGWSSGGHLSALAGTANGVQQKKINGLEKDIEGNIGRFTKTSSRVHAVVDWFGPTDFLIMDSCGSQINHNDVRSPESSLIGGAIQQNKEEVAFTNPVNYVTKSSPPFLILHGNKDPLVPHCQSERLYEKLQREGVTSELVLIDGGGHGPGVLIDKYYDRMIGFFKKERDALQK